MADLKQSIELTETQKDEAIAFTIAMYKQQAENDKRYIKDLVAENQRYKEALTWQPIATVPKDGTKILIAWWHSDDNIASITMTCYDKGVDGKYRWYGDRDNGYGTHWMPLPKMQKITNREQALKEV
jgi:hypothetical protein